MDLNHCLTLRRKARTALRNYIVNNFYSIQQEFKIDIPQTVKNMSGANFSNWIFENSHVFMEKRNEELDNFELIDLVADFICCSNNVTIAESINNLVFD